MAKLKLTPWFPPEVKPVHVGEYNASASGFRDPLVRRWWDGKIWSHSYYECYKESTKQACREFKLGANDWIEWRGLAEQPKEQKK